MTSSRSNIKLLKELVHINANDDVPLHSQLREGLSMAIENYFEDGQRFYNEKELIENLGLSQVTVRRALSDLVRDGILDRRVAKGSFVRKDAARSKDLTSVTIVAPDWDSSFIVNLIRECSRECQTRGIRTDTLLALQGSSTATLRGFNLQLVETHGLLLIGNEPPIALDLYRRYGHRQRVVNIDSWVDNYAGPYVGTNSLEVTQMGLDHLQQLGHTRICMLVNEPEFPGGNVSSRIRHFTEECTRRKLNHCPVIQCGTNYWENSYDKVFPKMPEIMDLNPRPTAIFTFDDMGAWAVMKWLDRNGVKVPGDISVIGFSDDRPSMYTHPALTTIAQPIHEIAEVAVELLCSKRYSVAHTFLSPKLVVRESTGEVKKRQS